MESYLIKPGSDFSLADHDADDKSEFLTKKEAISHFTASKKFLVELQELLYAEHKHKILIVLQAMDTGGKDGTIRHLFNQVSPVGIRVAGFKKPTTKELDHDYLWRIHKHTPGKGEIVIFNRSHYEDIIAVRINNLVQKSVWSRRYKHLNDFERMLSDEGTTILKFFLHIDKDEQRKRLQDRFRKPDKHWKISPTDLEVRKLWNEYMQAYEDVIRLTSTEWAPWYVIPANRKWYRNLVISRIVGDALSGLNMKYPKPDFDPGSIEIV